MIRRLLVLAALAGVLVGGVLALLGDAACGGRRLGGDDRPDARAADVVGRARAVAARRRRRRNRARRDGVGARDGRVPGRGGCRGHARRRKRARGVRGRACATRADEAARARAADRAPPPRGRGRGGARRRRFSPETWWSSGPARCIPVDGVAVGEALVDEAALTGEPLPVSYAAGAELRSGSANAGEAFDLRATRLAAESTYAAIVRLVRGAETQRAPFVRLADRYAALFLPLALGIAGLAWAASGDPVRFVAVMVVATPCPLILAAPIALIAGVSRAARHGVIVKGSGVIEQLGKARTVLFDKTGTLTLGQPALERVVAFDGIGPDELLRLAASVDQLSAHVLAEALVHAAQQRGFELASPAHVVEGRGQGIEGRVDGRSVAVGSSVWLRERGYSGAEDGGARARRER